LNELSSAVDWVQVTNLDRSVVTVSNFTGGQNLGLGGQIVGLLSTPRYYLAPDGHFITNLLGPVRAKVHALSGSAIERSASLRDFSFSYVLESEIVPFLAFPPAYTNFTGTDMAGNTNTMSARSNLWVHANRMARDCYELRLTLRWPVRPDNSVGNERQTFRALLSGGMVTNTDTLTVGGQTRPRTFYFFQSSVYGH
jgi:hypothetical protein